MAIFGGAKIRMRGVFNQEKEKVFFTVPTQKADLQ
jgi:hypothetical protein